MAFDLNSLKNKKEEVDTFYLKKLQEYLNSGTFEEKFQEYLENEIENGSQNGIIMLIVSKTNRVEVFLQFASYDFSISYDFCQDSQDKIGNLKNYIECIENKLDELKLNYKEQFGELYSDEFEHIAEHSTKEYKFFIKLNFE